MVDRRTAANVCDGLLFITTELISAWKGGNQSKSKVNIEELNDYMQDFRRIIKEQLYHNLK